MNPKQRLHMAEAKNKVLEYFLEQIRITSESLKVYDNYLTETDTEVKKIRAIEEVKLRDRLDQLHHHVSVLKLIL